MKSLKKSNFRKTIKSKENLKGGNYTNSRLAECYRIH